MPEGYDPDCEDCLAELNEALKKPKKVEFTKG